MREKQREFERICDISLKFRENALDISRICDIIFAVFYFIGNCVSYKAKNAPLRMRLGV